MEPVILIAVHGITVLVGVIVGYKLAGVKFDVEDVDYEPVQMPQWTNPFKSDAQPKPKSLEEIEEDDKKHAFFD